MLRCTITVPAECMYENLCEFVEICLLCLPKTSAGPAMAQFTICAVKRLQVLRDIFGAFLLTWFTTIYHFTEATVEL